MDINALTGLVAVTLGNVVVLIPIAGLTARFALKPLVDAFARVKEINGEQQKVSLMEQRIALLEEHFHSIDRNMEALREDADFRRQLDAGGQPRGQFVS